jgi:hypothetical protein
VKTSEFLAALLLEGRRNVAQRNQKTHMKNLIFFALACEACILAGIILGKVICQLAGL